MDSQFDAAAVVGAVEGPRLSIPFALISKLGLENAAFLQQSAFLSSLKFRNGGSGWFDLPAEGEGVPESQNMFERLGSWKAALGIKRDSLRKIRTELKKLNLLEEKKCGIPARIHYRVNSNSYLQFLASCGVPSSVESDENEHRKQECEISQTVINTEIQTNNQKVNERRKQECEISQTVVRNPADLPAESRKLACEISQYNPESYRELQKVKDKSVRKNSKPVQELDFSKWPSMPSKQVFNDWKDMRKDEHKAKLSQTVINRLAKQLTLCIEAGYSMDDIFSLATMKGWRGIEFNWIQNHYANTNVPFNQPQQVQRHNPNYSAPVGSQFSPPQGHEFYKEPTK